MRMALRWLKYIVRENDRCRYETKLQVLIPELGGKWIDVPTETEKVEEGHD